MKKNTHTCGSIVRFYRKGTVSLFTVFNVSPTSHNFSDASLVVSPLNRMCSWVDLASSGVQRVMLVLTWSEMFASSVECLATRPQCHQQCESFWNWCNVEIMLPLPQLNTIIPHIHTTEQDCWSQAFLSIINEDIKHTHAGEMMKYKKKEQCKILCYTHSIRKSDCIQGECKGDTELLSPSHYYSSSRGRNHWWRFLPQIDGKTN